MSNYGWLTDIHLDHVRTGNKGIVDFINNVKRTDVDGYFITGDISNSHKIVEHLGILEAGFAKPIMFVLGNHDYWGSSFSMVRKQMADITKASPFLKYMPTFKFLAVNDETAVVGHDGWYDGLNGLGARSKFLMNDWLNIADYRAAVAGANRQSDINMDKIVELSAAFAMDGVRHVFEGIKEATRHHSNIIVLTHVPPWEDSHMHNGTKGDASAQPWFTSKLMAQLLEKAADTYTNVMFTVLAGHTHGKCDIQIRNNMRCIVGAADYCNPVLQDVISL